jgi:hypothetical protein
MHYAYHVGQIVFLAKHFKSGEWKSLSVPRNKSAEFNAYLEKKVAETTAARKQGPYDSVGEFVDQTGS